MASLAQDICIVCDGEEIEETRMQPGFEGRLVAVCALCETVYDVDNPDLVLQEGML